MSGPERVQRAVLIAAALLSMVLATLAGYYWWDAIVVVIVAAVVGSKKLLTLKGLFLLLKKFGFVLLFGSKKLLLGLMGRFLLLAAHLRWRWLRCLIVTVKRRSRRTRRQLQGRWDGLGTTDRLLALLGALPLLLLVILVMGLIVLPRTAWAFLIARIESASGAAVLKKTLPRAAKDKATRAGRRIDRAIKARMRRKPRETELEPSGYSDQGDRNNID